MPDKGAVQVTGKPLPVGGELKNRVFDLINEFPGVQRKILVEKLGVPERTVDRYLAELISGGKIERRGSKKTGHFRWLLSLSKQAGIHMDPRQKPSGMTNIPRIRNRIKILLRSNREFNRKE